MSIHIIFIYILFDNVDNYVLELVELVKNYTWESFITK